MSFQPGLLGAAGRLVSESFAEFAPFQPDRDPDRLEQRYTNEASAFVHLRGARVHYRDEGPRDGPVLVAIHGTYSSLHTWDEWVERLDGVRVVRLDMPGFGLTGPREGTHRMQALVATVAALCDHLELSDVTVAGNSLGGGVAWRLSLERPDLIERLLLLNAGGTTLVSELSSNLVTTLGTGVQRYATPRVAVRLLLRDAYGDPAKLTDDVLTRYHDLLLRRGNRAAVLELVRRYEQDHYDSERHDRGRRVLTPPSVGTPRPEVWDEHDIDDVPVPALFQWGTADSWLPTDFGRELASRIDDSRFVTYEGVGHVPMEEAPAETVADAAEFIE